MNRVIRAAAALDLRYQNPSVAAFNRSNEAKSERAREFWFSVGRALYRPPACAFSPAALDTWQQIYAAQAESTN